MNNQSVPQDKIQTRLTDHEPVRNSVPDEIEVEHLVTAEASPYLENFTACKKSTEHKDYITFCDLSISHVPGHNEVLLHLIQVIGALTVKVEVTACSDARSGEYTRFPCSNLGTGRVLSVRDGTDRTCGCKRSRTSSRTCTSTSYITSPSTSHNTSSTASLSTGFSTSSITSSGTSLNTSSNTSFSISPSTSSTTSSSISPSTSSSTSSSTHKAVCEIEIMTAKHVVFDADEAEHAICFLDYDGGNQNTPSKSFRGGKIVDSTLSQDWTVVEWATCSQELAAKLKTDLRQFYDLSNKVNENPDISEHIVVIVSHPHGCYKQVSVGEYKDKIPETKTLSYFTYNVPTCAGSSGAYVYTKGREHIFYRHIHRGVDLRDNINRSAVGKR